MKKKKSSLYEEYFFKIKVVISTMFPSVQKCSLHVQNDNSDTLNISHSTSKELTKRVSAQPIKICSNI